MLADFPVALRNARRNATSSLAAVLTLAVAIAGTTAISSFVRGILLRPLPYPDADSLVSITRENRAQGFTGLEIAASHLSILMERSRSFAEISGASYEDVNLSGEDRPERVQAAIVLPDLLSLLGIEPFLGRSFLPEEIDGSVILTHRLWMSRYGGRAEVIGATLRHDGKAETIVGVLPQGAEIPLRKAEILMPMNRARLEDPSETSMRVLARLAPGATFEAARKEVDAVSRWIEEEEAPPVKGWRFDVTPLRSEIVGDVEPALLILQAAVLLALFVACANFAALLIARGAAREREMAVRAAIGAGRADIARLLLAESVSLALFGGLLSMILARWGTDLFLLLAPEHLPRSAEVVVDGPILAFALALALASGIFAGALPAFVLSRVSPERSLRSSSSNLTRRGSGRLRDVLTLAQLAAALTLTVGTGLLARSLVRLLAVDPGFDASGVLSFEISFPKDRYPETSERTRVVIDLLERIGTVPEVQAVAVGPWTLMTGSSSRAQMSTEDLGGSVREGSRWPMVLGVSPGFFRTLSIPFREGRDFDFEERAQAGSVAIVNRLLAERAWPGRSPLGRRIKFGGPGSEYPWLEVVGVVENARLVNLSRSEEEALFLPLLPLQRPRSRLSLVVKTQSAPESLIPMLRAAVREVDEDIPLAQIRTMDALVADDAATPRFHLSVVAAFAALAIGLGGIGIHSLIASWTISRRREIGLRMTLGADPRAVLRMVLVQGAARVTLGLFLGTIVSLVAGSFLASSLFGVGSSDPATFALSTLLLGAIGIAAAAVPARRAARTDPAETLRAE